MNDTQKQLFAKGDRVAIPELDCALGTVLSSRIVDQNAPVLTIELDDATLTTDGFWCAREWEVLNLFQLKMLQLDCELTGKPIRQVAQQMHHKPKSPVEWFGRSDSAWYLSDGGYSRVCLMEDLTLYLTSNSLATPKAQWESTAELRAQIEADVKAALRAEGMIL